jgi:hypothetical protein
VSGRLNASELRRRLLPRTGVKGSPVQIRPSRPEVAGQKGFRTSIRDLFDLRKPQREPVPYADCVAFFRIFSMAAAPLASAGRISCRYTVSVTLVETCPTRWLMFSGGTSLALRMDTNAAARQESSAPPAWPLGDLTKLPAHLPAIQRIATRINFTWRYALAPEIGQAMQSGICSVGCGARIVGPESGGDPRGEFRVGHTGCELGGHRRRDVGCRAERGQAERRGVAWLVAPGDARCRSPPE